MTSLSAEIKRTNRPTVPNEIPLPGTGSRKSVPVNAMVYPPSERESTTITWLVRPISDAPLAVSVSVRL